jgi:Cu/Ag efflux pump CusA
MKDVRSRLAGISFPLEYHAEILPGRAAQDQAGFWQVLLLFAVALAGTFLLLQAATGSWRLAFGLVLALAASLVGGALAIPANGAPLSIGELVGFLAVLAIGARNGIALTGRFQRLERDEGVEFGLELVRRGARERLMPTRVTAFASALVVLPFVLLGDRPGYEVVRPMALVILGGVATSTFTSLFVMPALYLLSGPSPEADVASSYHLAEQPAVSPA